MNPRARRATVGAAALGAALVVAMAAVYRDSIRNHVEAWHFQLTRNTKTFQPQESPVEWFPREQLPFYAAARQLGCPVIFDPAEAPPVRTRVPVFGADIKALLEKNGWRILEQRFPRRAHVFIRSQPPVDQPLDTEGLLWDGLDVEIPVRE